MPHLGIYKARLPSSMRPLLSEVIALCESYANNLPQGWKTNLYSLTKQDMVLAPIPGALAKAEPITRFILEALRQAYPPTRAQCPRIRMDGNQPHVLKYSVESGHVGVELHHDRCDVTANLALNQGYCGGGTHFPAAHTTVVLQEGEFLLHPGSLVHGGRPVTWGSRYVMVFFCHVD
jgi:hypothetical protein